MLMVQSQEGNLFDLVDYVLERSVAWHTERDAFLFAAEIVHFYVRDRVSLVYMIADEPPQRTSQHIEPHVCAHGHAVSFGFGICALKQETERKVSM